MRAGWSQTLNLPYVASWKQLEFHLAREVGPNQPVLYGGAMGGAKSWGLCGEAIRECLEIPNNRVLLARKELVTFRRSTLVTLLPLIPANWGHHKAELHFIAPNGSELHYSGLGTDTDIEKLKSTEWGFIGIDEVSEIARETILMAGARLRWKPAADANHLKLRLTSNPEQCWLKTDFIDTPKPGYKFILALPSDNPYLPVDYVSNLELFYGDDPAWREAYLYGSWDAAENARQVVPAEALLAISRQQLEPGDGCIWGVDVARYGKDRTVVAEWRPDDHQRGPVRIVDSWMHKDTYETKENLVSLYQTADPRPTAINVDVVGLGAGVVDSGKHTVLNPEDFEPDAQAVDTVKQLKKQRMPIRGVNSGEAATKPDQYRNRRAEMAWTVRNLALNRAISIPDIPELRTDLGAYRYDIVNDRVIGLELKIKMRDRIGHSPDLGDAVMLACGVVVKRPQFFSVATERNTFDQQIEDIRNTVILKRSRFYARSK